MLLFPCCKTLQISLLGVTFLTLTNAQSPSTGASCSAGSETSVPNVASCAGQYQTSTDGVKSGKENGGATANYGNLTANGSASAAVSQNDSNGNGYGTSFEASSVFRDFLTINASAPFSGTVTFTMRANGSSYVSGTGNYSDEVQFADVSLALELSANVGSGSLGDVGSLPNGQTALTATYTFSASDFNGSSLTFGIYAQLSADGNCNATAVGSCTAGTNYAARVTGYTITDANGNAVPGLGLTASSGTDYNNPSTTDVLGQITLSGAPLSNVNIALSTGATTTTDSAGNYAFGGLPAGSTYTITPTLSGYNFTPPSQTIANLSANQTANFVASALSGPLGFIPVTPCRIVDTRAPANSLGGPTMSANSMRSFPLPTGACGLSATASAYSLNVTVVPQTTLQYLSLWPTDQPQPVVSTLNSFDGRIVANAAIVPAGTSGAINVFATDQTDIIIDVNGYFGATGTSGALTFVPVTPCRVEDTRNTTGVFGGPSLSSGNSRSFPIPSSNCSIPATAAAYSLNATVVPTGTLQYLTLYPTGASQPYVSTLNSYNGQVVANAAIVPAGTNGAITAYVTDQTNLITDINGYFTSTPATPLVFHTVTPCRVVDTRNATGTFGGPIMAAATERSFPIPGGSCGIPSTATAYAFNVTVVPTSTLHYLTLWPDGQSQPTVSTLNSYNGQVVANAALVPAGTSGAVDVFVTDQTHVILDIVGYFSAQ